KWFPVPPVLCSHGGGFGWLISKRGPIVAGPGGDQLSAPLVPGAGRSDPEGPGISTGSGDNLGQDRRLSSDILSPQHEPAAGGGEPDSERRSAGVRRKRLPSQQNRSA